MKLLLIRHGETLSNVKKVYAGRSHEELTERGVAQAKEVAEKLKGYRLHALYSSPIQRAVQTATIIGERIGKEVIIENSFREMEMGPWEGMSEKDIATLYPREWKIWWSRPALLQLPGRETLEELLKRVLEGIKRICQDVNNETIVVVTHVAMIRVLFLWHENKSLNLYKKINIPNASIFEININL